MPKTEIRGTQIKDDTLTDQDIGQGAVRGSTANSAGSEQEIAQGTISTPDLRSGAVTAAKLNTPPLDYIETASAVNKFTVKDQVTGQPPELQATGGDANIDLKLVPKGAGKVVGIRKYVAIRLLDKNTDAAVASAIGGDFRLPFAGTIREVGAYVDVAGVTGTMTVDINKNGATIMTTNKIGIETAEKSSLTAAQQPVLTTTAYARDDILTFDIDAIQTTAAKGLTVWLDVELTG